MALDRMHFTRAEIAHPESEADAVVGMHWLAILPYAQKVVFPLTLHWQCVHTLIESDRLVGGARREQVEVEHQTALVQQRPSPSRRQSVTHLPEEVR